MDKIKVNRNNISYVHYSLGLYYIDLCNKENYTSEIAKMAITNLQIATKNKKLLRKCQKHICDVIINSTGNLFDSGKEEYEQLYKYTSYCKKDNIDFDIKYLFHELVLNIKMNFFTNIPLKKNYYMTFDKRLCDEYYIENLFNIVKNRDVDDMLKYIDNLRKDGNKLTLRNISDLMMLYTSYKN